MRPEGFRIAVDEEHPGRLLAVCSECGATWGDLEVVGCEVGQELAVGALQALRCHREAHGSGELPRSVEKPDKRGRRGGA